MMREAYVGYLNDLYAREAAGQGWGEDVSMLKINEVNNWMRAWMFMERFGFKAARRSIVMRLATATISARGRISQPENLWVDARMIGRIEFG
jgi:hypothetical protein